MEDFKKELVDNLFSATKTEELSIGRLFEVADTIAPFVLKAAKQQMMKDAVDAKIIESANTVSKQEELIRIVTLVYNQMDMNPYLQAGDKVKLIIIKED